MRHGTSLVDGVDPEPHEAALYANLTPSYIGFLLVAVRLAHASFGSVLTPELIFARTGGRRFYQPSFFGRPVLAFGVEPGIHAASFTVDIAAPRGTDPVRLMVTIRSNALERRYEDGAQFYRCDIEGGRHLVRRAAGRARPWADGDFDLSLFHVTNPAAFAAIRKSCELWSSPWNLQGIHRLANVVPDCVGPRRQIARLDRI